MTCRRWVIGAIVVGMALSATFALASCVIASAAAFLLSEPTNLAVNTPLQRRGLIKAVSRATLPASWSTA
jgi:hypothetical protein